MFYEYLEKIRSVGRRAFTLEQAQNDLSVSKASILSAISRLKKRGKIFSPVKGLYVIIPPEYRLLGCLPAEELIPLCMRYLNRSYYAGLLTAGKYYGAAHQKPAVFQVFVDKRMKSPLKCGQVKIEFFYKKNITNSPLNDFKVQTGYLKISSPELTAMDLLQNIKHSGGINNVATVLSELIESIKPDRLITFAQQQDTVSWLQRLGYILEKLNPMDTDSKDCILKALKEYLASKSYKAVPLDPKLPVTGYPRNNQWKVIENETFESDI